MSERAKEQQELERKLVKMGRQLDHLERAKREEEVGDCLIANHATAWHCHAGVDLRPLQK